MTVVEKPKLARVTRDIPLAEFLQLVDRDGGVIIEQLLPEDVLIAFNAELDELLRAVQPGSHYAEFAPERHGTNTKRMTNVVTTSKTFRERIITDSFVHSIVDEVMTRLSDSYWLNSAQVIDLGPGTGLQPLHRDAKNYPVFLPAGPDGPEVMCNFLIALTQFTEDNGATRVIPASNRWPDFNDLVEEQCQPLTIAAEMNAGDALYISGKTVHGGGANITPDVHRRALALAFNPGFLVPEEAYPFLVPLELVRTLPRKVQQMIGFRSFLNWTHDGSPLWQKDVAELADYLGL